MKWAEKIREICEAKGQTANKTAADLGVSRQYLSALVNEIKEPSPNFKLKIWSELDEDLDLTNALAFMKENEAKELKQLAASNAGQKASKEVSVRPPVDWVDALVDLRNQRGLTDALFAAELGVSPAFICMVFARKKPVSWRLKMAIWSRKNYDLSRDAILNLFLPEIGQQLIDMDRQRGQKRAEKIAQKRERKNGITAQS